MYELIITQVHADVRITTSQRIKKDEVTHLQITTRHIDAKQGDIV